MVLKGLGASRGQFTGRARRLEYPSEIGTLEKGDILCVEMTTPEWTEAFAKVGAVVTATGSITCHAAVVAREYKIPCVVAIGAGYFHAYMTEGTQLTIDGKAGTVEIAA